jgi:hypothetical protein
MRPEGYKRARRWPNRHQSSARLSTRLRRKKLGWPGRHQPQPTSSAYTSKSLPRYGQRVREKVELQAPGRAWGINFELKLGNLSRHGHFERKVARWLQLTKWKCRKTNPVALERMFEQSVRTRGQVLIVRSSHLENRRDRMNNRVRKNAKETNSLF